MTRQGFSLVELLVAAAILGVVLGLATVFLADQTQLSRTVQTRSELQDVVRSVAQVVAQDLQMAGSGRYTDANGNIDKSVTLRNCVINVGGCLTPGSGNGSTVQDSLSLEYVTSLRPPAQACRQVAYRFSGSTLERSDVACGSPASFQALAENVLALDVIFVCSNRREVSVFPDATDCPRAPAANPAYPRTAKFSVVGRASAPARGATGGTYTLASKRTVSCPSGFSCFALEQETLLPNLKDN